MRAGKDRHQGAGAGPGALVIDGDYGALGVVRSLGRRGIRVWVVRSQDDHRLSALSRYCRREVLWPEECDEARLDVLRLVPDGRRHRLDVRSIRPAGAAWLRPRLEGLVPIELGREVGAAEAADGGVAVTLSDGARRVYDHVLLGTGYRVHLSRYPFLSPELLARVRQIDGYPVLGRGFESSVPGLHFLGAPAARSYGPLMRFVAGTPFTAAELARTVVPSARARSGAVRARR